LIKILKMNKYFILIFAVIITACQTAPKDYVTISGKIDNAPSKSLKIFDEKETYTKDITINDDGTFKDTLKVTEGRFYFKNGNEYGNLYLQNGAELNFSVDAKDFDNTLSFTGKGKMFDASSFAADAIRLEMKYLNGETIAAPDDVFNKEIDAYKNAFNAMQAKYTSLDADFFKDEQKGFDKNLNGLLKYRKEKMAVKELLAEGKISPEFNSYDNFDGSKTSLKDLKGKYAYIDVWATWCGPCKKEIPSLKKIEKAYHGKNINFVSISVDKNKAAWKKMVTEKKLGGIQLHFNNDNSFSQAYKINGIPRFIIVDPEGKIVDADAPRPSNPALIKLFDKLNI